MAFRSSQQSKLLSLFVVFFCLGCSPRRGRMSRTKTRRSALCKPNKGKAGHSVRSSCFMRPIIHFSRMNNSRRASDVPNLASDVPNLAPDTGERSTTITKESEIASTTDSKRLDYSSGNHHFASATCEDVFTLSSLQELHHSTKQAMSELWDCDSAKRTLEIIFLTGWTNSDRKAGPTIQRVLKIHRNSKVWARFVEYRETVKKRASKPGGKGAGRCPVDGNELLRFYCSTFVCSLLSSGLCGQQICGVCQIVGQGFSPKVEGISTMPTSKAAHDAAPVEVAEKLRLVNMRRAMLVCRVVAGRVAPDSDSDGNYSGACDSMMLRRRADCDDELVVFSPDAVLPCFVVVYTT